MTALPRIATARLVLRPFAPEDGPAVERLAGAFEVADTTLHIPHPYPAGGGGAWIATHAAAWKAGAGLTLALAPAGDPASLVGAMGLAIDAAHARAEIGYWVGVPHWGRGFATEAARALIGFAFRELGLNRVQGRHLVRNPASGRVMERVGMRHEGILRESIRKWDRFEDLALLAVLRSEWRE